MHKLSQRRCDCECETVVIIVVAVVVVVFAVAVFFDTLSFPLVYFRFLSVALRLFVQCLLVCVCACV